MSFIGDGFQMVQQGWQCPTCHRVYSPVMPMCTQCPVQTVTTSGTYEWPDKNPGDPDPSWDLDAAAEVMKRTPKISDREAETE